MWIYLICFAVSCLFLKIADLSKKGAIYNIFIIMGLIIPCILAGFRADTIGTDVQVYVKPMFEAALSSSDFSQYQGMRWIASWTYMYVHDIEIGFSLLVYIIAKVFGNMTVLLTCIEILIIFPFYKGLSYFKKDFPMWLCMLVFYLMNYNVTLNMMRQWIAMSLLFYGFKYVIEKKLKKFIFIVLVAMTFHTTAILGILFYFIYSFIYSGKNKKRIKIFISSRKYISLENLNKVFIITIVVCLALLSIQSIAIFLNNIELGKYAAYIQGDVYLLPIQIILRAPFIILILLNWNKYNEKYNMAPIFLVMMIIDLLVSQLGSISQYSWRIATYFSMFNCLSYPSICLIWKKRITRISCDILLIMYLISYWVYYFVLKGVHQTIPYIIA